MYEMFWDYNLKLQKMLNIEWQVDCKTSGDLKLMPRMVKVTKFQTILMYVSSWNLTKVLLTNFYYSYKKIVYIFKDRVELTPSEI